MAQRGVGDGVPFLIPDTLKNRGIEMQGYGKPGPSDIYYQTLRP
jgi:hypothetical protein